MYNQGTFLSWNVATEYIWQDQELLPSLSSDLVVSWTFTAANAGDTEYLEKDETLGRRRRRWHRVDWCSVRDLFVICPRPILLSCAELLTDVHLYSTYWTLTSFIRFLFACVQSLQSLVSTQFLCRVFGVRETACFGLHRRSLICVVVFLTCWGWEWVSKGNILVLCWGAGTIARWGPWQRCS